MSVYIEIDGKPIPAKDVVWIERGSCGCINSVSFNNYHAKSVAEMYLTGEQFASSGGENPKAVVERDREDGFTQEAITEASWNALSGTFKDCPHDPKWGRPVVAVPDEMVWTTVDRWYGRRTYKRHLVTADHRDIYPGPAALCGSKPKKPWSIDRDDLRDTVTCRKCESKAVEMAEVSR